MQIIDEQLKKYATERQAEYIDAVNEHGGIRRAARALGVGHSAIIQAIDRLKRSASRRGYSPEHDMVHPVPEGFIAKGVSTYYDETGKPRGQWVKSSIDHEHQKAMMRAVFAGMADELPRLAPVRHSQNTCSSELLNCYVISDYHFGMLAWRDETGADWDLDIAERTLVKWFEQAIAQAPDTEKAVFAQLSDLLHYDGFAAVTPESKHLLDADGRFPKLVRTVIRVIRQVIDMLLVKHKHLHIVMCDANHDPVSQVWLREWLSVIYENEPRISVDTSPSPYNAFEFGKVALFFHHGHKRGMGNVSEVFASQFREMFGRTKHAFAHVGHRHHLDIKENNLMIVEQHRTLAAPDAYAARGGWASGRDAKVITYHKEHGEVGRVTINYSAVAE